MESPLFKGREKCQAAHLTMMNLLLASNPQKAGQKNALDKLIRHINWAEHSSILAEQENLRL